MDLRKERLKAWRAMSTAAHSGDHAAFVSALVWWQHLTNRLRRLPDDKERRHG